MILHRILRGANAGLYLPFALSRLRALERIYGTGVFSEKYRPPGFEIEVQQDPPFQYIRINAAEGIYFEFLTNGLPLEKPTVTEGGNTFQAYKAAAVGVNLANDKIPRPFIVRGEKVAPGQAVGAFLRTAQADLIDEPMRFLPHGYGLFETFAPIHPHTGIYSRQYNCGDSEGENSWTRLRTTGYGRGMLSAFSSRDMGIDVAFQYNIGSGAVKDALITKDADWPRANGIQVVTDPIFGTRRFGIYIDACSQFHVFPLLAIEPVTDPFAQNVPEGMVQKKRPEFPSWAYVNEQKLSDLAQTVGVANSFVAAPDLDWKVSPDGTKACVIVYEREPAVYDHERFEVRTAQSLAMNQYFAHRSGKYTAFKDETYRVGASGVDARHNTSVGSWFSYPTVYHTASGLLEVGIKIEITGSDLDSFRVELNLETIRRPTLTPYCTFLAGYSGVEIKADDFTVENQHYRARANELCVLDIERWWNPAQPRHDDAAPMYLFGATPSGHLPLLHPDDEEYRRPYRSFMVLKNLSRDSLELRAFGSAAVIDYDFPTLSFAMLERKDVWEYTLYNTWGTGAHYGNTGVNEFSGGTYDPYRSRTIGGEPYGSGVKTLLRHIAVSIFTLNQFREVLFPESMPEPIKLDLLAAVTINPRDYLTAGYELMPLNDLRPWGDASSELFNMREVLVAGEQKWPAAEFAYSLAFGQSWYPYPLGFINAYSSVYLVSRSTRWAGFDDIFWQGLTNWGSGWDQPSLYTMNWLRYGAQMYAGNRYQVYLTEPRWGWAIYADEIQNRLMCAPSSTFFTHPNGAWAFYSAQFIYNRNETMIDGMLDEWVLINPSLGEYVGPPDPNFQASHAETCVNTLDPFDVTKLEHCIFDRVHLVTPAGEGVDTTFLALYNEAEAKVPAPEDGGPNLKQIDLVDLRATFTKQISSFTTLGFHASTNNPALPVPVSDVNHKFPDVTFEVLDLKVAWQGSTVYYRDFGYFNMTTEGMTGTDFGMDPLIGFSSAYNNNNGVLVNGPCFGGHGLVDLTMGTTFTTLPHHTGQYRIPDVALNHTHFSSCAMSA